MTTLTIPRELMRKGPLVLVPQGEYEELLRAREKRNWISKPAVKTVKSEGEKVLEIARTLPVARRLKRHKKFYEELDKSLAISLRQIKEGKTVGPFRTAKELMASLNAKTN